MKANTDTKRVKPLSKKWITPVRRLGIYLRDGLACCYCGASVEDGAQLSLDHVIPHSHGGSKKSDNLVTACRRCNSARGNRSMTAFAVDAARFLGHATAAQIVADIRNKLRRKVLRDEAYQMIERRGSVTRALQEG